MSEEYALLSSEIEKWPSKDSMIKIIESANLTAVSGKYSIRIKEFDHFVFREYGGDIGSPCITAEEESPEELSRQSKIISEALSKFGIRHRFEVYDGNDELVAYHHYNWEQV